MINKKSILFIGIIFIIGFALAIINIHSIEIDPDLDISYFDSYNLTANITNSSSLNSVRVNFSAVNGEDGGCAQFYVNGTCAQKECNSAEMSYEVSSGLWKKQNVRPDCIYPQIEFGDDSVFWANVPENVSLWRDNYHLFNYTNNFRMEGNMSFWIEFDVIQATSSDRTSDLEIYVVANGSNPVELNYFDVDWRNSENTLHIATYDRNSNYHHEHSSNSQHYLVPLTTNSDGTIGSKNLNLSDSFWIILYSDSNKLDLGWNLRYQPSDLCENQNAWYTASKSGGWKIPTLQYGCPNANIHLVRRAPTSDYVNATLIVTDSDSNVIINSTSFLFGELPNLAPVPTSFINPVSGGVYNQSSINITWESSSDPNGDSLTYNISLLNSDATFNSTLNVTESLSYLWNITNLSDGTYSLKIEVCDNASTSLCSNNTLEGNFTISKTENLYELTSISLISNNSINSSFGKTGNSITLYFNSTGLLTNLNVSFFSGGYSINNLVTIENSSTEYNATYLINSSDFENFVGFEIQADNLDLIYSETTDNSSIIIDDTSPSLEIISPINTIYDEALQLVNISSTDNILSDIWYNWNGTNITYSSEINITFSEGSNSLYVWSNDSIGNLNFTNVTFTISTSSDTNPTSNSGSYSLGIINLSKESLEIGNNILIRIYNKVLFPVKENIHTLKLLNYSLNSAFVSVSSETQIKELFIGEEWIVDVDLDGENETSVTLNSIPINFAGINITIREYQKEEIPEISSNQEQETGSILNKEIEIIKNNKEIIIYILSLVILAIISFFFLRYVKKTSKKKIKNKSKKNNKKRK